MTVTYQPGQVLTAAELNSSLNAKVDAANAQITGGQIQGVTLVQISGTTDSTSPSTGALTVAGGAGVGENLQVGQSVTAGGSVIVNGNTQSTSATTGAVVVAGGIGVGGNVNVSGSMDVVGSILTNGIDVTASGDSTSPTTGVLVVAGGAGIGKTLNVGGNTNVGGTLVVTGAGTVDGLFEAGNVTLLAGGALTYADGSVQSTAGAIDSEFSVNSTGGTVTISAAQAATNNIFKVTGALTSNLIIDFPAKAKNFTVQNNTTGSFSVTCQATGQTPSVGVVQGTSGTLFTDATGCYATSAASGIGFSGEFSDATGLTLTLTHIGAFVQQTASGITTTLPKASTYPAGKGVVIGNKSTGTNNLAHAGGDTMELPTTLMSGDVYFAASDGVSNWAIGWYSATKALRVTSINFADGTTQTTANGTTMPTSTQYSVALANATLNSFTIVTAGYTAPFVTVFRNGIRLINGPDWAFAGDGLTINLNIAVGKNDVFEVLTNVIITPTTSYQPSSQFFTPAAGLTSIPVAYTVGFVAVYVNGSRFVVGQDCTATDGANINFTNWTFDGQTTVEVVILTPMTYSNSVVYSAPVLGGSLTFADGSSQGTAAPGRNRIINGACRVSQRVPLALGATSNGYGGPDRYFAQNATSAGQFTQSQGNITYNGATKPAVVQTVNTAVGAITGSNYLGGIQQRIEGFNCYDMVGQKATLSFIFSTNISGTYCVSIIDGGSTQSFVTSFTATAGTPQRVTIAIPSLPTNLSVPGSNAVGLYVTIGFLNTGTYQTSTPGSWQANVAYTVAGAVNWGATAGNFIAATDIKLEAGGAATPMEPLSYAQELVLCQRYYEVSSPLVILYQANVTSGAGYNMVAPFKTTKRTTATCTYAANGSSNFGAPSVSSSTVDGVQIAATANATAQGYFQGGYTASAEL